MKFAVILLCGLVLGCASSQKPTLERAIKATIAAADVSYELTVEFCDAREKEIIRRAPTTLEQDKEDLAHVREVCDQIFMVFEGTRRLNLLLSEAEHL